MTDEELYTHAAGIYENRSRNLKRILKERNIDVEQVSEEEEANSRQRCIEILFQQLKEGSIRIVQEGWGFRAVKNSH